MAGMIPHRTGNYKIEACQRMAQELRATGKYTRVQVRTTYHEGAQYYGQVWVSRWWEEAPKTK